MSGEKRFWGIRKSLRNGIAKGWDVGKTYGETYSGKNYLG